MREPFVRETFMRQSPRAIIIIITTVNKFFTVLCCNHLLV